MKKLLFKFHPVKILNYAFLICFLITICLLYFLPNELPMQFSSSGSVNWTLPKYLGVWLIPGIAGLLSFNYLRQQSLDYGRALIIGLLLLIDIIFLFFIAFII